MIQDTSKRKKGRRQIVLGKAPLRPALLERMMTGFCPPPNTHRDIRHCWLSHPHTRTQLPARIQGTS